MKKVIYLLSFLFLVTNSFSRIITANTGSNTTEVSITSSTTYVSEPSNSYFLTISLNNPSTSPTIITFSISGTATNGIDYINIPLNIVIPANTTSLGFPLVIIDDQLIENSESVIFSLISTNNAAITINTTPAVIIIYDNDDSILTITPTTPLASEQSTNGLFTISNTIPMSTTTIVVFTITGTAINGIDFVLIPVTIIIPANTTSITIPVTIVDDLEIESTETVIITLMATDNPLIIVNPTPATVYIANTAITTSDTNSGNIDSVISGNISINDMGAPIISYGVPIADQTNPNTILPILNPNGSYTFTTSLSGIYIFRVPVCISNGPIPCQTETLVITVLNPLDIKDNIQFESSVYPNPSVNNKINIETETDLTKIEIVTINGQVMQQIINPKTQNNVYTLENLQQGFYLLKLESENKSTTKKIIIN